jgi:hypothetical protein
MDDDSLQKRRWHWPTEEGWIMFAFLIFAGGVAGGFRGMLTMAGFLALVNVLGNWSGI